MPLWGKEAVGISSRKGMESPSKRHLRLLSCSLPAMPGKEALAWLTSRRRENPRDQSGGKAERELRCPPLFLRGHCLNPVITRPGPKAGRVNALRGEPREAGSAGAPWGGRCAVPFSRGRGARGRQSCHLSLLLPKAGWHDHPRFSGLVKERRKGKVGMRNKRGGEKQP